MHSLCIALTSQICCNYNALAIMGIWLIMSGTLDHLKFSCLISEKLYMLYSDCQSVFDLAVVETMTFFFLSFSL